MPFKPLVTAGIETALNTFLWRDKALKPARQRLLGKVLRVELKELSTPVVLVFSERQVDVLGTREGDADCTVITRLSVLPQLRNRQQLTALIRSGDLEVQGDLQVVQNTVALCDLAEFDPAELLAPPAISLRKGSVRSFAPELVFCCTALSVSSGMSLKR